MAYPFYHPVRLAGHFAARVLVAGDRLTLVFLAAARAGELGFVAVNFLLPFFYNTLHGVVSRHT